MKITTPSIVAISLALSVLCHASIALFFTDSTVDEMLDGGVQGDVAMIGTSFADMVSKDNMIARAEPEETAQTEPESIQPEDSSSSAEQVTDTKDIKPTTVKPLESVKAQTTATTSSEPVAKPVKSSPITPPEPTETAAVDPRDEPQPKSSASQHSQQPDAMAAKTTPTQSADSTPKASLSAVADTPTSHDTPAETAFMPPITDTIAAAKNEVQRPAVPKAQISSLQINEQADKTPAPAQSNATVTPSDVAKPVDEIQKPSAAPQLSQAAKPAPTALPPMASAPAVPHTSVAPSPEAIIRPKLQSVEGSTAAVQPAPEIRQALSTQIAPLKSARAAETAIAADVAQTAEEGIPAPRARPPQPHDGKIIASKPKRVVKKTTQKQTQKKAKKRQPAAKGNQSKTQRSAQNNSGKSSATASRGGGKGSNTKAAGNAKASNYPGLIYRKIQRTRQKRVGGRGSVRIRFSVSSSGGLAGISVARSSGSSKIDKAALAHIRRAAPFPAPPKGARRSFTIPVEIRR